MSIAYINRKANSYNFRKIWCPVELMQFKELEDKIKSIVHEYSVMKKRNQELEEQLKNKIGELEEVNNKIRGLVEERDAVRTKVDRLLVLLQDVNMAQ